MKLTEEVNLVPESIVGLSEVEELGFKFATVRNAFLKQPKQRKVKTSYTKLSVVPLIQGIKE